MFSISRDGRKEKERENSRHEGKGENRQQLSIEQIHLYCISFDGVGLSVQRILISWLNPFYHWKSCRVDGSTPMLG
jgi:hypothetical protein